MHLNDILVSCTSPNSILRIFILLNLTYECKKNQSKESITALQEYDKAHLRILSKQQRKQVGNITSDWAQFTTHFYSKMFDKL